MDNLNNIQFKPKKDNKAIGTLILVIAICSELIILPACINTGTSLSAGVLIVSLIMTAFFIWLANLFYNKNKLAQQRINQAMATYGEAYLRNEISYNTIKVHKNAFDFGYVFFTNQLIIDPGEGVIPYGQIAKICVTKTHPTSVTDVHIYTRLIFTLINGEDYILCDDIRNNAETVKDMTDYINICLQRNYNIQVDASELR